MSIILTIELVPKTCWYSNVRSEVSKDEWDKIKRTVSSSAGYKCEICNGKGPKWPVECHEIWSYDNGVQRLERFIALCPSCHEVKHIGLATIKGRREIVVDHFAKVNVLSLEEANKYVLEAFNIWHTRSQHQWSLDISYLDVFKVNNDLSK